MSVPAARRLLQLVLPEAAPRDLLAHNIDLSDWRHERNRIARERHAKAWRRRTSGLAPRSS